ncbi:MAG: hypothetical protein WBL54_06855, partial [Nitrososphaeraceae archaeon]
IYSIINVHTSLISIRKLRGLGQRLKLYLNETNLASRIRWFLDQTKDSSLIRLIKSLGRRFLKQKKLSHLDLTTKNGRQTSIRIGSRQS